MSSLLLFAFVNILLFEICHCADSIPAPPPPRKLELKVERTVADHIYTIKINVGGRPLDVVIDTGSSFLWVANDTLTRDQYYSHSGYDGRVCNKCNVSAMPIFGYNISLETLTYSNWQDLSGCSDPDNCHHQLGVTSSTDSLDCICDPLYIIRYYLGNITGYLVNDEIGIGNDKVPNYNFGVAISDSTLIAAFTGGVFGLGYPIRISNSSFPPQIPPLDAIFPDQSDIFCLYFGKCPVLLIGQPQKKEIDRYYYPKFHTNIDLMKNNSFMFQVYAIGFYDDYNMTQHATKDIPVLIDSGTSYLVAPGTFNLTAVVRKSFDCGDCVYPSKLWQGVWELNITKIDVTKNLPPLSIYYGQSEKDRWDLEWCYYLFKEKDLKGHIHYLIGITTLPNLNFWVLGDIFLQKYFVEFNKRDQKLGIAPAKGRSHNTNPLEFCKKCDGTDCPPPPHCQCREFPEDDYIVDYEKDPMCPIK